MVSLKKFRKISSEAIIPNVSDDVQNRSEILASVEMTAQQPYLKPCNSNSPYSPKLARNTAITHKQLCVNWPRSWSHRWLMTRSIDLNFSIQSFQMPRHQVWGRQYLWNVDKSQWHFLMLSWHQSFSCYLYEMYCKLPTRWNSTAFGQAYCNGVSLC